METEFDSTMLLKKTFANGILQKLFLKNICYKISLFQALTLQLKNLLLL